MQSTKALLRERSRVFYLPVISLAPPSRGSSLAFDSASQAPGKKLASAIVENVKLGGAKAQSAPPRPVTDHRKDFQILVSLSTGATLVVTARVNDTAEHVYAMIGDRAGGHLDQQQLSFAGKKLKVGRTLEELGVHHLSTIHLSCSLKGGMKRGAAEPSTYCPECALSGLEMFRAHCRRHNVADTNTHMAIGGGAAQDPAIVTQTAPIPPLPPPPPSPSRPE
jgi:hypothetical protein